MSILKRNIIANFGGGVWTGLVGLIFVPLYIHFMGIEAYGLVGIFAMLLAIFGLLDMGLSSTLNREMARLAVQEKKAQEMRDLVRTLEIPYWIIGLIISVIIVASSQLIAFRWVNAESLSPKTVQTAIVIMGLTVFFQWPLGFYSSGLIGLQRQVMLNGINAVMATFRGLCAVLILWLVSPTVEAFFLWQLIASVMHTVLVVYFLWRSLPDASERARFRRELLSNIWKFAAGMTGIAMLGTILTQMDKVILSRMLSLKMFGYYALASAAAMTLVRFSAPIFSAIYPRLTSLVALGATEEITRLYHRSSQLVSVLVLPAAVVVALFSKEILLLWTQSPVTVEHTHLLVSILVMGTAINGLVNIPYALQLAVGWTRLAFLVSLISVIFALPLMIVLANWYDAVGVASVWVILNVSELIISIPIMHKRLLRNEKWRWYFEDVGLPFGVALLVAGSLRFTISTPLHNLSLGACIVVISAITLMAAALVTPVTRDWIQGYVSTWKFFSAAKS